MSVSVSVSAAGPSGVPALLCRPLHPMQRQRLWRWLSLNNFRNSCCDDFLSQRIEQCPLPCLLSLALTCCLSATPCYAYVPVTHSVCPRPISMPCRHLPIINSAADGRIGLDTLYSAHVPVWSTCRSPIPTDTDQPPLHPTCQVPGVALFSDGSSTFLGIPTQLTLIFFFDTFSLLPFLPPLSP